MIGLKVQLHHTIKDKINILQKIISNHLVIIEIIKGLNHIKNNHNNLMISMINTIDIINKIDTINKIGTINRIDTIKKIETIVDTKNTTNHKEHKRLPPKSKYRQKSSAYKTYLLTYYPPSSNC